MSFFDEGDEPTRATRPPGHAAPTGRGARAGGGRPTARPCSSASASAVGAALLLADPARLRLYELREQPQGARAEGLQPRRHRARPGARTTRSPSRSSRLWPAARARATSSRCRSTSCGCRRGGRQAAEGSTRPSDMSRRPAQPPARARTSAPTALRKIADEIPRAQGRGQPLGRRRSTRSPARCRPFLASDVVYSQRVAPCIKQALDDDGDLRPDHREPPVPARHRVAGPETGRRASSAAAAGGTSAPAGEPPARHARPRPDASSVGTRDAAARRARQPRPGRRAARRSSSSSPTRARTTRTTSRSTLTITGGRHADQRARRPRSRTVAKARPPRSTIPLPQAPPIGQAVTVEVKVEPVAGREEDRQQHRDLPSSSRSGRSSPSRVSCGAVDDLTTTPGSSRSPPPPWR